MTDVEAAVRRSSQMSKPSVRCRSRASDAGCVTQQSDVEAERPDEEVTSMMDQLVIMGPAKVVQAPMGCLQHRAAVPDSEGEEPPGTSGTSSTSSTGSSSTSSTGSSTSSTSSTTVVLVVLVAASTASAADPVERHLSRMCLLVRVEVHCRDGDTARITILVISHATPDFDLPQTNIGVAHQ